MHFLGLAVQCASTINYKMLKICRLALGRLSEYSLTYMEKSIEYL